MKLLECTGALLRYDVPADAATPPSAILLCSDCGAVLVGRPDERHAEAMVLSAD
jgi:hypothetical protein